MMTKADSCQQCLVT
uniref:Uncharacterized protein n=1 Tax=Anopheles dirus TaxID=7168 RepID=A0A182NWA7_9DIPT